MRLDPDGFFHLTYCTNIHPATAGRTFLPASRRYAPRAQGAPRRPTRRSASACAYRVSRAASYSKATASAQFRAFLDEQDCTSLPSMASRTARSTTSRSRTTSTPLTGATKSGSPTRCGWSRSWPRSSRDGMDGGISTSPLSYKPGSSGRSRHVGPAIAETVRARGSGAAQAGAGHAHPSRYRAGAGWPAGDL